MDGDIRAARIKMVEEILGEESDPWCKHCKEAAGLFGHADDCSLGNIRPSVLLKAKKDASIFLKKNINRQRIFKPGKSLGLGGKKIKTLVRKKRIRGKVPQRELRECRVCDEKHIFELRGKRWTCTFCYHSKPCRFGGRNCQTCYPKGKI